MKSLPRVDIIITAFERFDIFKLCIESCLRQDYPNFQIVVFDNSKKSDIHKYILELNSNIIKYTKNDFNYGSLINMRQAFTSVESDFFYMLSSDTILESHCLSKLVDFAVLNKLPAVFSSHSIFDTTTGVVSFPEINFIIRGLIPPQSGVYDNVPIIKDYFYGKDIISFSIYESLIHTKIFKNLNLMKDLVFGANEVEHSLAIKFLLGTTNFGYIHQPLKQNYINHERHNYLNFRNSYYKNFARTYNILNMINVHANHLSLIGINTVYIKLILCYRFLLLSLHFNSFTFQSLYESTKLFFNIFSSLLLFIFLLPLILFITCITNLFSHFKFFIKKLFYK
jgi:glycosyltransferase involved in cell wall biosynthesis